MSMLIAIPPLGTFFQLLQSLDLQILYSEVTFWKVSKEQNQKQNILGESGYTAMVTSGYLGIKCMILKN